MRQLFLEQSIGRNPNEFVYRVLRVVNSVKPKVDAVLQQDHVIGYCDDVDWKVDIISAK